MSICVYVCMYIYIYIYVFFGFAHIAALCCCCCVVRLAVVVARLFALLLRWGRAMDIFISQGSVSGPPGSTPSGGG